jgi:hypothetical protein
LEVMKSSLKQAAFDITSDIADRLWPSLRVFIGIKYTRIMGKIEDIAV